MTSELQVTGRPCITCTHPQRAEIEEAMLTGDSLSRVSNMYGIDRQALDRHRSRHLAWTPELAQEAGLAPETVVTRLLDIATRLDDDARAAWESGDAEAHRKAALAATRAWATVGAVGGNGAQVMAAKLEGQKAQLKAIAALIRRHPELVRHYALELERQDAPMVAESVRAQFLKTTKEIES